MKALVVFESMFGNTEQVARAVADGLADHLDVEVVNVDDADPAPGVDVGLLIVGGPTHALGLSRGKTRADAEKQATETLVTRSTGLREWLAAAGAAAPGSVAAAFATKMRKPRWLPGSAARSAGRRLNRLGYREAATPEDFFVGDTSGPLLAGELDRARKWGEGLGAAFRKAG